MLATECSIPLDPSLRRPKGPEAGAKRPTLAKIANGPDRTMSSVTGFLKMPYGSFFCTCSMTRWMSAFFAGPSGIGAAERGRRLAGPAQNTSTSTDSDTNTKHEHKKSSLRNLPKNCPKIP